MKSIVCNTIFTKKITGPEIPALHQYVNTAIQTLGPGGNAYKLAFPPPKKKGRLWYHIKQGLLSSLCLPSAPGSLVCKSPTPTKEGKHGICVCKMLTHYNIYLLIFQHIKKYWGQKASASVDMVNVRTLPVSLAAGGNTYKLVFPPQSKEIWRKSNETLIFSKEITSSPFFLPVPSPFGPGTFEKGSHHDLRDTFLL